MPPADIHIDRIRLDLRGISPMVAQGAIASLGPALDTALASPKATLTSRPQHIAAVAARPLQVPPGADVATLRRAIADQVATAITQSLSSPENR